MFVMPANAGIQVRFQFKFKNRLDSAGMTGARVDFQSTNSEPLGLERRVVQFYLSPEFLDFFLQSRQPFNKPLGGASNAVKGGNSHERIQKLQIYILGRDHTGASAVGPQHTEYCMEQYAR